MPDFAVPNAAPAPGCVVSICRLEFYDLANVHPNIIYNPYISASVLASEMADIKLTAKEMPACVVVSYLQGIAMELQKHVPWKRRARTWGHIHFRPW